MTLPIYAATAGAILIILQALLMVTVGLYRAKSGINLGVAGDKELERRIRRHGNLAENAGLFVAVLAVAEMTVVPSNVIKYIAIAFVIARLSHAAALSTEVGSHGGKGSKLFVGARVVGAFGTLASFLSLGGFVLYGLMQQPM